MSRYRWTILAVGTGSQACFATVSAGLAALAPALRADYGLSLGQVGLVLGAVGVGMLATLLPWGLAADRIGERPVIAAGLAGAAVALLATAWTTSLPALLAGLAVAGASGASANAASGRAVMGWFEPRERGLALGIRQTAIPLGGACAAATLPWLAEVGGSQLALVALGCCCLAGSAAAALWMRESPRRTEPEARAVASSPPPVRDPAMWLLSGASSLYLTAQLAISGFVVLFLHQQRGLSPGTAAAVLAVINVLGAAARIGAGRWSDRAGTRLGPLRLLGLALAAGTVLAAVLADAPLTVLLPALVVAGVLGMSWNGLSFTAAAETAGTARAGAALGLQQTMLAAGGAVIPIVFAAVVSSTSWRTGFAVSALGPLAGWAALRRLPERTAGALSLRGARSRGRSASPPAARGTRG